MDLPQIISLVTQGGVAGLALVMWFLGRKDLLASQARERELVAKLEELTKSSIQTIANNTSILGSMATILQPKRRG